MNNQNLKPFNTIDPIRHAELSRLGGIASGKARREKRERIEREKYWAKEYERRMNERVNEILRELNTDNDTSIPLSEKESTSLANIMEVHKACNRFIRKVRKNAKRGK